MSLLNDIQRYFWLGGRWPGDIESECEGAVLVEDIPVDVQADSVEHEAVYLRKHMASSPGYEGWGFIDEYVRVRYNEPVGDESDEAWKRHTPTIETVHPTTITDYKAA